MLTGSFLDDSHQRIGYRLQCQNLCKKIFTMFLNGAKNQYKQ